jgi:hypothetical protein
MLSAALIGLQILQSLPSTAKTHIKYAALWSSFSLLMGAYALALLPSRVRQYDVAADRLIGGVGLAQLFLMVVAAVRTVLAIRTALRHT